MTTGHGAIDDTLTVERALVDVGSGATSSGCNTPARSTYAPSWPTKISSALAVGVAAAKSVVSMSAALSSVGSVGMSVDRAIEVGVGSVMEATCIPTVTAVMSAEGSTS